MDTISDNKGVLAYYDQDSLSVLTYDLIENALRTHGDDVAFYKQWCEGISGHILELGAGTGRVSWALASAGFQITGLDLSQGMLDRAEAKRIKYDTSTQSRCKFVQGDMTSFQLENAYERVLIPFRSFNHLLQPEQQIACLRAIHLHLAPGAKVAIHLHMIDRASDWSQEKLTNKQKNIKIRIEETGHIVHSELLQRRFDIVERAGYKIHLRVSRWNDTQNGCGKVFYGLDQST